MVARWPHRGLSSALGLAEKMMVSSLCFLAPRGPKKRMQGLTQSLLENLRVVEQIYYFFLLLPVFSGTS